MKPSGMTSIGNIELPVSRIHIISNNDVRSVDFLSDAGLSVAIREIQSVYDKKQGPALFLARPDHYKMAVLIICRPPVKMMKPGNELMLFIGNNTEQLYGYFHRWRDNETDKSLYPIVDTIVTFVSNEMRHEYNKGH